MNMSSGWLIFHLKHRHHHSHPFTILFLTFVGELIKQNRKNQKILINICIFIKMRVAMPPLHVLISV